MERFMRRPLIVVIPVSDVVDVKLEEQPLSGILHVVTPTGTIKFDYVRPKMRTWPFFWRLKKELESRRQRDSRSDAT
jgi:hypothetical protein